MEVVQPIKSKATLRKCNDIAKEHDINKRKDEVSWELILLLGLSTGLRVSDFTRLKVNDIRGKDHVDIRAKKTNKYTYVPIYEDIQKRLNEILSERGGDEYILQSRENAKTPHIYKPISRQRCWQIINSICSQAGVKERVGCHTLRKTYGYHYYRKTGDLAMLQSILGHSYRRETLIYIGIYQDQIDNSLKNFDIFN